MKINDVYIEIAFREYYSKLYFLILLLKKNIQKSKINN